MATADRMSAYSVIVCPLRNSLARTYSFVMNSISPPSETSPCGEVLPFFRFVLGLELAVDRAEQRVDVSAHGLVANEHHDGDRRQDERVLVIVCPLRNSLARTYSFVMNFVSPPSETSPVRGSSPLSGLFLV